MEKRKRINGSAIYHTEPSGRSFMMRSEILSNKLKAGTITQEEMWELAEYRSKAKSKEDYVPKTSPKPKKYIYMVIGREVVSAIELKTMTPIRVEY